VTRRKRPPVLVALSPGDLVRAGGIRDPARDLVRTVEACVRVGLRGFLLREPALSDRDTTELALALRDVLGDGWLAIHDRAHLVPSCRADAVHLGFRSLTPAVARAVLGPQVTIGFSAHERDDRATWNDADYVFFGPVLDTPSKRGLVAPTGFDGLARAVSSTPTPVWALGGLGPDDASRAAGAGASGMAVLGGITRAEDPASACARYVERAHAHFVSASGEP